MRKMTDSLVDQGSREDLPTGSTPRKRVWQYTDSWELTKDRDTIIEGWKWRAVQSQDDECASSSRCPSPVLPRDSVMQNVQDTPRPANVAEQLSPLPPPYVESNVEEPPTSNFPLPMAPLVVPALVPAVALPAAVSNSTMKTKIGKSVIPAMGTLTERSTNLIYGRGTRRAR
jgi:kinesin family member 11